MAILLMAVQPLTSAHGTVVEYFGQQDRNNWFGAAGGSENVTTIAFTEFPNGTTLTEHYAPLGMTFSGTNFVSGPFPTQYHDDWGLQIISGNDLYFDEPINWIAADFLGTIEIELYANDEVFFTSNLFGVPPFDGFGGIHSDQPFDRVRIYDPLDFLTVLDDLHFGPIIAVPAPPVLAMLALAPLICTGRRRPA